MQESYGTLNLEYVEVSESPRFAKITAIILSIILAVTPMYELITGLKQESFVCTYGIVSTCGCIIGF